MAKHGSIDKDPMFNYPPCLHHSRHIPDVTVLVRLRDCVRTASVDDGGNCVDTITDLVPTPSL